MLDADELIRRMRSFPANYMQDFNEFWRYKLAVESGRGHILDEDHVRRTYYLLADVLAKWRAFRPRPLNKCLYLLEKALINISGAYDEIRKYDLLHFRDVPIEPLELIWHELGMVKNLGARSPHGRYFIISVCKPLMLLWGQTPAFDARVRENLPPRYHVSKTNRRWSFWEWRSVMMRIQRDLALSPGFLRTAREEAKRMYGADFTVPYGRFLDIYFWVGPHGRSVRPP